MSDIATESIDAGRGSPIRNRVAPPKALFNDFLNLLGLGRGGTIFPEKYQQNGNDQDVGPRQGPAPSGWAPAGRFRFHSPAEKGRSGPHLSDKEYMACTFQKRALWVLRSSDS
jgi:hypothetical protein